MNRYSSNVVKSYENLKNGEFQKSIDFALKSYSLDHKDFWACFFASVAAAYLQDIDASRKYLDLALELSPDSVYLHYLQALHALVEHDAEKALWHWTLIHDKKEGWLARQLLEKMRKDENLIEKAAGFEVGNFIVLPEFHLDQKEDEDENATVAVEGPPEITVTEELLSGEHDFEEHSVSKKEPISFRLAFVILGSVVLLGSIWFLMKTISTDAKKPGTAWQQLSIKENASLVGNPSKVQYRYATRQQLVDDFENARRYLKNNRINHARYLLQRIILSNADFKSIEKSKIFLRFIPEVRHEDFPDPVSVSDVIKEPEFYQGATVLWQGIATKIIEFDKGRQVQLMVSENNSNYLVEAFLPTEKAEENWLKYKDFEGGAEPTAENPKRAVVFGTFKSLIGKQNTLYLELKKIWL